MCNYNKSDNNIIYASDRICRYAISEIWNSIRTNLYID